MQAALGPADLVAVVALLVFVALVLPSAGTAFAATDVEPDAPTPPPVTVSDFYPEDANLSDCVGFVERPGCGSEARGGLQMTLIFLALATGLGIIFWRITVGVKRNRASRGSGEPADDTAWTESRPNEQEIDRP